MKKIIFILILFFPFITYALEYPNLNSKIVEIYDLNDQKILYEKNSNNQIRIASLTKIATTITAIENIDDLNKKVTITTDILNTVSDDASVAGLKEGDIVTYKDLLYASMLPSGADATNALAITSSGSIENFVNKMNNLTKTIGLTNTHFTNVNGLDSNNHFSTANDIRILLEYSLNNSIFKDIYTTKEYTLTNGLKVKTSLNKYNKNIDTTKIIGSKTGFTYDAGYCLTSLSNINGHDILILVLNATYTNKTYYNIKDTTNLIDFLSNNYKEELLLKKYEYKKTIPVKYSNKKEYTIYNEKNIIKYLPSDYNKDYLKIEYNGPSYISYRNRINKKIGTINYYYQDELIATEDIILKEKFKINILLIIIQIIISLLILLIIKIYKKNRLGN